MNAPRKESKPIPPQRILKPWYAALAVLPLAIAVLVPPESLPPVTACLFHRITGYPCAGCGMTRAFCALGHARFHEAWSLNPFSYLFFAATLAAVILPIALHRRPAMEKRLLHSPWLTTRLPILVAAVMTAFGAARILGLFNLTLP